LRSARPDEPRRTAVASCRELVVGGPAQHDGVAVGEVGCEFREADDLGQARERKVLWGPGPATPEQAASASDS